MRVLLVTWTDNLLQKLSILSPQLEYCAIVVDELEPAQKILERINLPKTLLRPLHELKECVNDFYYDYVLCLEDNYLTNFMSLVLEYGVPKNKVFILSLLGYNSFLLERSLQYFKEHAAEFDMFATGLSYVEVGLDVTQFKRKLFNFGRSSQDLYYNFQVAKHIVAYGRGHRKLRYALIGLAPYLFHYDHSKTPNNQHALLQYFISFGDLHNFYVSAEDYRQFLRKEYLSARLSLEPFDLNDPYLVKDNLPMLIKPKDRLTARALIDSWAEKNYPETRTENIKIFDDYLTLCEVNNIRPIMFLPPMTECYLKHFKKQRLDEFYCIVQQAGRKHPSAVFIDGWQLRGLTDSDFYDVEHMNIQGAAKFSAYLNHIIEQLDGKQ